MSLNPTFQILLVVIICGMHHVASKNSEDAVMCVKGCVNSACSNMDTLLTYSVDTSSKLSDLNSNTEYYRKASNLKEWVKSVFEMYVNAFANSSFGTTDSQNYFPNYSSTYSNCVHNCALSEGSDSIARYLSDALNKIEKNMNKRRQEDLKRKKKSRSSTSSAPTESHDQIMARMIEENRNRHVNYDTDDFSIN